MNNLVIVALPKEDDYIYKISSEKVAHMTFLFLGEVSKVKNLNTILGFVQHAADQSLTRFGLEVDHRGVLGPEQADVLFFSKSSWGCFDQINAFRSYLLQDDNIRTAYDATPQFGEWVPHLTLGYPATPAHEDTRDYPGTYYVEFDRVAVWVADFEGFEFSLKSQNYAMMQAERFVKNYLAHHGEDRVRS